MLSTQAFNAFLKTLEEPPSYAIFILATTEKHKILPTILSRCQIFDFNRIKVEHIAGHLANIANKEEVTYDQDGLHLIAQKADGGLRDALSMFDQIVSFSNKNVSYQAVIDNLNILDYDYYFKLTDAILAEDAVNALLVFDEVLSNGFDGSHFISGLASHFRNLLVGKDSATLKLLEVSENIRQRYIEQAQQTEVGLLLSTLNIANQCEINYRTSKNQRLQVELALLKMCHVRSAIQFNKQPIEMNNRPESVKKKPDTFVANALENASSVAETKPKETIKQAQVQTVVESNIPPESQETRTSGKLKIPSFKDMKLSSSVPSLSDVFKDKKEVDPDADPEYIMGSDQQHFTYEDFLKIWHALADKAKAESKITLFTLMTANPPKLRDDFKVEIMVENAIQENLLSISKIDILNELRVKLKNFAIDLIPVQAESNVIRKPYTNQEKYQAMLAKNPLVDKLRQEFNLGFD